MPGYILDKEKTCLRLYWTVLGVTAHQVKLTLVSL